MATAECLARMLGILGILLAGGGLLPAPCQADDLGRARALLRSEDPKVRSRALKTLAQHDSKRAIGYVEEAIRRSRRDMARLTKTLDAQDVAWQKASAAADWARADGRSNVAELIRKANVARRALRATEAVVNGHLAVVRDAGRALATFRDPGAVRAVEAGARSESDPYIRQLYIAALGTPGHVRSVPVLLALLDEEDPRARAAAARALQPYAPRWEVVARAKGLVTDGAWPVRLAAMELLARAPFEHAVPALVEAALREEGELALAADSLLASLTGRSYAQDTSMWKPWWQDHSEAVEAGTYTRAEEKPRFREGRNTRATFFRIPIDSRNVLFAIDFSASMKQVLKISDLRMDEVRREFDLPETRLGWARTELIRVVRGLPDGTRFNVLIYGIDSDDDKWWSRCWYFKGEKNRATFCLYLQRTGPDPGPDPEIEHFLKSLTEQKTK